MVLRQKVKVDTFGVKRASDERFHPIITILVQVLVQVLDTENIVILALLLDKISRASSNGKNLGNDNGTPTNPSKMQIYSRIHSRKPIERKILSSARSRR